MTVAREPPQYSRSERQSLDVAKPDTVRAAVASRPGPDRMAQESPLSQEPARAQRWQYTASSAPSPNLACGSFAVSLVQELAAFIKSFFAKSDQENTFQLRSSVFFTSVIFENVQ